MTNAPIMVFDDSMSSVDMETDAKIRQALRENTAGATVILISHRISTLMHADTILVLENGRIAELGSHGQLLGKNGIYKRVYDLQSAADLTRGG
jgi:ATP-binding cassette subfamily B protein